MVAIRLLSLIYFSSGVPTFSKSVSYTHLDVYKRQVLVLLFLAELFYFKIADKCNIIDTPNERSSHTKVTLRGGGIIFYFGALA